MAAPLDRPKDLTVPGEGSATTRTILSRALGRVCRELPGLLRAHAAGELRDDVLSLDRAIRPLFERDPGAIATVLRRPHTSTLARLLRTPNAGSSGLASELFALLAFDLAWLGVLPCDVTLRHLPSRFVSPTARGAVAVPPHARTATFRSGQVIFDGPGERIAIDLETLARGGSDPLWTRPYVPIGGDALLALADNNPLSSIDAHPDKTTPNHVDLAGHTPEQWAASLRSALAIIDTALPPMAQDIGTLLQQVIPTGFDAESHVSCSYREDIGTIYLSLHPLAHTMAEALIHEVSHNKLNALMDIDPILENDAAELYASPVRPDPRPIFGVLLAVHAFVPVACMYERLVRGRAGLPPAPHLEARFAAVVRSNRAGTDVLREHARGTPIGQALLGELFGWDNHFRASA